MSSVKLDITEAGFEGLITKDLLDHGGWQLGHPKKYDSILGLYPEDVISFVVGTQPEVWGKLVDIAGSKDLAAESLLNRLARQLTKRGTVEVLRNGITEKNLRVRLCYFRPNLTLDDTGQRLYDRNILRVVRQVHHDPQRPRESIDLVLFINGVPTATAELKNRWTGQQVDDAIKQYQKDRDPTNVLLGKRALVHFALDSELAYMTTKLEGEDTVFLPFNQGSGGPGQPGGAGNPPPIGDRHPTSYVWEQVWQRDAWLELIEDFVFVKQPSRDGERPTVIFPRFHQWDVVRAATEDAMERGPGHNYLIQHSAGSGKTNEISWLAHDLSTLHVEDRPLFDKVVVVTDRRVLDQQLQRQIRAFAQTASTVQEIEEDSDQLIAALTDNTVRVLITTLQKFPFVLRKISDADTSELKRRTYAVIVDEAHSSQTGDAATDLKQVVGARKGEDLEQHERDGVPPELLERVAARGRQPNVSYFAFTATPKARTLELFGRPTEDGHEPFHVYSMRQAIEERYIVDVLRNYSTYQQLYRLETTAHEEVPTGSASRRLAQFAKLHPYAKAQKAEVIVEHFVRTVRPQLQGEGKAMVVTDGREEAVRYKQALDRYIAENEIQDVKVLVAFSDEVEIADPNATDFGRKYRESQMNAVKGRPLSESQLPKQFDKAEYGILVVAEKYQTGFDQPKLIGMYVDKPLSGITAVQTLSRLNRVHEGKADTFVVDFANDTPDIHAAFEHYFGKTEALPSDPNLLSDAAQTVLDWEVIDPDEIVKLSVALYDPDATHHALSAATARSFETARKLEASQLKRFRGDLDRFVRFYRFLAQVVPYLTADYERLYEFCRALGLRLGVQSDGSLAVAESVELTHYRLESVGEHNLSVAPGTAQSSPLAAFGGDGTGRTNGGIQLSLSLLDELVQLFNRRFGGVLTEEDALPTVSQLIDAAAKIGDQKGLADQAKANAFEDFERDKQNLVVGATLQVKDLNEKFLGQLLDDEDTLKQATRLVMRSLYDRYREEDGGVEPAA